MIKYKEKADFIIDLEEGLTIPKAPGNRHYQMYQDWLAEGNIPEPEFTEEQLRQAKWDEVQAQRDAALQQVKEVFNLDSERPVIRQSIEDYLAGEQGRKYIQEHGSDEGFVYSPVSAAEIDLFEAELYQAKAAEIEKEIDMTAVRKMLMPKVNEVVADKDVDQFVTLFPAWRPGEPVKNKADSGANKEDRRQHKGVVWKCMTSHTTQVDWEPGMAPTLWSRVAVVDPGTGYPVWKVWDGHNENLHKVGDIVWYPGVNTTLYIATLGNNHWNPSSGTGWKVYTG